MGCPLGSTALQTLFPWLPRPALGPGGDSLRRAQPNANLTARQAQQDGTLKIPPSGFYGSCAALSAPDLLPPMPLDPRGPGLEAWHVTLGLCDSVLETRLCGLEPNVHMGHLRGQHFYQSGLQEGCLPYS